MICDFVYSLDVLCFVFVMQNTAYDLRICDWSSDVCSSDLAGDGKRANAIAACRKHTAKEDDVAADGAGAAQRCCANARHSGGCRLVAVHQQRAGVDSGAA